MRSTGQYKRWKGAPRTGTGPRRARNEDLGRGQVVSSCWEEPRTTETTSTSTSRITSTSPQYKIQNAKMRCGTSASWRRGVGNENEYHCTSPSPSTSPKDKYNAGSQSAAGRRGARVVPVPLRAPVPVLNTKYKIRHAKAGPGDLEHTAAGVGKKTSASRVRVPFPVLYVPVLSTKYKYEVRACHAPK